MNVLHRGRILSLYTSRVAPGPTGRNCGAEFGQFLCDLALQTVKLISFLGTSMREAPNGLKMIAKLIEGLVIWLQVRLLTGQ